jgi:hypothetical protein
MRRSRRLIHAFFLRLYGYLLHLYPARFRLEFEAEIQDIFGEIMLAAESRGGLWLLKTSLRELSCLVISIFRECWHDFRSRKGGEMASNNQIHKDEGAALPGGSFLQPVGAPKLSWVAAWTLLTTAAIPAALVAMAPLAAAFLWLLNLGVEAGFWPAIQNGTVEPLGLITAMTLTLASVQWYLLRKLLPRAWLWFAATGAGVLLGGLTAGLLLSGPSVQGWEPYWIMAAMLVSVGLALGLAQFIYLHRLLPNAFWIVVVDLLAAASILLAGESFTSLAELMVLFLPGVISGAGLWLLLRQSHPETRPQMHIAGGPEKRRIAWVGLAALVPLFFGCIWAYAASQLVLAKNEGVYATPEEAVIKRNSQGWGGARVVRIENVWAEPNSRNAQPHVWFGGANVYLDRIPQGGNRDHYSSGSFYLRVREGWVHVPEGAFPEFVGWVMSLYNMEGVRE